jgi:hypothetical protein
VRPAEPALHLSGSTHFDVPLVTHDDGRPASTSTPWGFAPNPTLAGRQPEPEPEQRMLLEQLRLTLPSQSPPKIMAAQVRVVAPALALQ